MSEAPVAGLEDVVDKAIKLNEQVKILTKELEGYKKEIRDLAGRNIEVDGTCILVAGTKKSAKVVFSNKRKVKIESDFKPETLPKKIRDKFFVEVTCYQPIDVDLFEKALDGHSEFENKFSVVSPTPSVNL